MIGGFRGQDDFVVAFFFFFKDQETINEIMEDRKKYIDKTITV